MVYIFRKYFHTTTECVETLQEKIFTWIWEKLFSCGKNYEKMKTPFWSMIIGWKMRKNNCFGSLSIHVMITSDGYLADNTVSVQVVSMKVQWIKISIMESNWKLGEKHKVEFSLSIDQWSLSHRMRLPDNSAFVRQSQMNLAWWIPSRPCKVVISWL